ncbi:MAG TPA: anti-sigma factor [Telluria sp.]|nr:anti-sigma factor [Telluria sp.]
MDCTQARGLLPAYLDNELDAANAVQLALHLATCPACQAQAERLLALRATLKEHATHYTAPAALRASLRKALRAAAPRRRPWASLAWAWSAAGAAGAAFAVTLALLLAQPSNADRLDGELLASHVRSLMPDHLADVASTDQHTVKPWFAGKLDYSPPVIDLARQEFALLGGRVDVVDARPVAALAYRHRQHIVNLYVWPDKAGRAAAPRASSQRGFQLLQWSQGGMRYAAVSDINAQELGEFGRLLMAQAH